jgi:hypothetical protein
MDIEHRGDVLRAIGQGFQYTAYATANRVLKVPLTTEQVCKKYAATWGFNPDPEHVSKGREIGLAVVRATRERLDSGQLPRWLLADAEISADDWISQSRVIPLSSAFKGTDTRGCIALIESYAATAKELVRWSTFETGYALLDNFGIDAKGRVVALDFGELTFDRSVALASVTDQLWARDRGGCKVFEGEVLAEYLSIMERMFTKEMMFFSFIPRPLTHNSIYNFLTVFFFKKRIDSGNPSKLSIIDLVRLYSFCLESRILPS